MNQFALQLRVYVLCPRCGKDEKKRAGCLLRCHNGIIHEKKVFSRPILWLRQLVRAIQASVFCAQYAG